MTQILFAALVLGVAGQRLYELRVSRRNERRILESGGREHAASQMKWMAALHALWLVAMLAEVFFLERRFVLPLAAVAFTVFLVGQTLRVLAMRTLGDRWTVKVMTLPGSPAVHGGIFRWLRHPNYLGVVLEIVALPLIHSAWMTAVGFTVANGVLLSFRIRAEERALSEDSEYAERMGDRPRFVPASRHG